MQAARGASLNHGDSASPGHHGPSPDDPAPEAPALAPRRLLMLLLVAVAAYAVDLVTKVLAVRLLTDRGSVDVVGELLRLTLIRNAGAAFSTGSRYTPLLSVVAVLAAAAVLVVARRVRSAGWAVALGLLLAGVVGNLTDRVFRAPGPFRGHVVDFLQLPHWPIFNVADMCINVAAALILVLALRGTRLDGSRPDAADEAHP